MATGKSPVAETQKGNVPDATDSGQDDWFAVRASVVKPALAVLARLLARQAAAEAVEQHEHETHSNTPASPDGR